ncbi:MAG TPA: zinc ribbon-containing protein [Candidatus Competibacteraceae bacterium]|nr:hypothetical protein [Candidatus Competibacteraceae bacterium]HPF58007.1 zinc ribbon-containing protein [Candidatus Competibacteraceae bacterium]HRY17465.1 zinc ribbon-containing protein [Candidatus Competibacteraceae bacterium]
MNDLSNSSLLVRAYRQMMERMKSRLEELEQAEKTAFPQLNASIEHAAEKAVEVGELTREEAQLIGSYLKRDLEDAGHYLTATGRDLRAWLRFDLELLEDRLLDFFQRGVDQSRLDLLKFETPPVRVEEERYRCGEITGLGTLQCEQCGEWVVFHAPAAIGPCPACGGTSFLRVTDEP